MRMRRIILKGIFYQLWVYKRKNSTINANIFSEQTDIYNLPVYNEVAYKKNLAHCI